MMTEHDDNPLVPASIVREADELFEYMTTTTREEICAEALLEHERSKTVKKAGYIVAGIAGAVAGVMAIVAVATNAWDRAAWPTFATVVLGAGSIYASRLAARQMNRDAYHKEFVEAPKAPWEEEIEKGTLQRAIALRENMEAAGIDPALTKYDPPPELPANHKPTAYEFADHLLETVYALA